MRIKATLCRGIAAVVLAWTLDVQAASDIYLDHFSGASGALHNRTPDTATTNGNKWIAATSWTTDGTRANVTNAGNSAFLPFVPVTGRIYRLSADMECISAGAPDTDWVALGFANGTTTTSAWYLVNNPVGWMLARFSGNVTYPNQTFTGTGVTGPLDTTVYPTNMMNYGVILDTRPAGASAWTFTFLINSNVVRTVAFGGSGPTISHVGFGMRATGGGRSYAKNFTLTEESAALPTKLAISSVSSGSNPTVGAAFSVVVQAQDASSNPVSVLTNTAVTLSLNTGSGTLGGTLTGTIPAGSSSVTISGVTYTRAGSGVVLTATRNSGDSLTAGNSSSFTVNPATVTVSSGLSGNNRVYDGTTVATISSNNVVLSGVLAGDVVNVKISTNGYTASFATAAVGSGKAVTVGGLTLTGSAAGNYTLTQPSLSANITAVTVTVSSGLTANSKVYNGTTATTITSNNVVLSGVLAGETANVNLSTNGYTASFVTAAVGSGKAVTVSGLTLTGSAAGNYALTQPSLSANVTVATVTVSSGLTANNKGYDGTTVATLSSNNVVLSGVVAGDSANAKLSTNGYSASFATAAQGNGKAVTVSGLTLTGSAAGNYTLTQPSLTANITVGVVTVSSGLTANNKVYDGTTATTIISNTVVLAGVAAGDAGNVNLSTNGYTASFATAAVGSGKTVTISGLTLTGSAAGNYTLTQPSLTANITAVTVTVSSGLTANNKVYDGTTAATIVSNNVVLSGVLAGDTANVNLSTNGCTASFATAAVGSGKTVTPSGLTLTGSAAGNYTLTQPSLSASITPIAWYNGSWTNRLAIVIDRTKVSGPLTNFPALINLTNASLQAAAQASGNDLLFTSVDGTTKLDHEIESYTNSNGALVAWVEVPILSSTADTTLYLYYGNASATNQQNVEGTWNSNFKAVWHLNGVFTDSTSNNYDGANTGTIAATGKISNGRGFVRANGTDYITVTGLLGSPANITLSAWEDLTTADVNGADIVSLGDHTALRQDYVGVAGFYYDGNWQNTRSTTNAAGTGWRYVVYTFDDAGNSQKVYVDGVQAASSTFTTSLSYSGLGANTLIGKNGGSDNTFDFDGTLDEVRVANTARSAGWVATEYNNQNSPATFYSVGSAESAALPTKLAITSVNSGSNPTVGAAFSVVVQAQDADSNPASVVTNTAVTLSLNTGSGTLGGTLTGTIPAGSSSVTISGVTYSKAEAGVVLTATRTSGVNLTAGNSSSFTVNPATVTVSSGLSGNNRVYDGTTAATISSNNVVLSGVLAGDVANVKLSTNGYTASFASATVGSGKTVTVGGLTLTGSAAANYTLTQPSLSANIIAATVTVSSGLTANNKVYSGTTAATIASNTVVLSGVLAGDTANVKLSTNGCTASFATTAVGSGKTVTLSGLTLTGSAAANYTLTQPSLSANITVATVTVSSGLTANNKGYDGTTVATLSSNNVVLSGVVAGDSANAKLSTNGYSASFATAAPGNGKAVTVSGLTLTGSAAGNYTLTQPSLTANITVGVVTVSSGLTANNKVYDATTATTIISNTVVLAGVAPGDAGNVNLSTNGYTASFATAAVGSGKTVTISGLTLTGSAAGNYTFTQPSLTANITAVTVTVSSGLTGNNKVYNGTTAATIASNNVVLSGVLAGDTANAKLSTNGYTASFATATVGSGKTVTPSGLTLTGSAAGNYTLTQPSLTANVTVATVTVSSGLTANNKPYDGTTVATLSSNNVVLSGVVAGDSATATLSTNGYTANFATAAVGSGKTVTLSGLTLTGSAAGNYTLTQPSLTANITVATVTVSSGLTANAKVYDGTTAATISSNNVVLSGVAAGDAANVRLSTNGYTASFANATAGSGKVVTVSGLTLTGSAAGSYTLTQPSLSANITEADWYNPAWTNRLAITIDHTKVASDLTNFPVLINLTNSSLQQRAQADGDDLLFTSDDTITKLAHELESYTSANGALVAWVNVPIVSATVDTVIYLYYGNSTAANQENATAVWDSNFKSVWHLQDDSASTPAPLYQWTFDSGDGVPVITAGGGTLAVRNIIGTGSIAFRSTNGVSQGVLDASANGYITNSAVALAANLTGLGTLNQFTVTFWVKLPDPQSGFPRLVQFAANSGYDNGGKSSTVNDGFGVNLHGGNLQPGFGSTNKYFSNTSLTGFGSVLASNTWTFVSLLYDGTSVLASNSSAMSTATGGTATNNMATYLGTLTNSVSFNGQAPITPNSISDLTNNLGPISFGNSATVLMGNHTNTTNSRGLTGLLDDVRIYNAVLTPAQLEVVRLSTLPNITDSTANAHAGTGTNMLSDDAQLAKIAGGMDFDGATNQFIQTTSSESKTATSLTWECWFKAGSTAFARHLLWQGTNTADGWGSATTNEPGMNLSLGDYTGSSVNNRLSFFFGDTDTSKSAGVIDAAVAFSDSSAWHHAAAVVTNISGSPGATLYLDGVAVASDTGTTARTLRTAWNTNLRLGAAGDGSKNYLGLLDEVRVSDINRSAAWIAAGFNNQSSPATFYSVAGVQSSPAVKLAITAINGGSNPAAGTPFTIEVESQDEGGSPRNVTADTAVVVTLNTGSGTLGGTLTGTISIGCNSVTISGVTYSKAESGVIVTATRTSGLSLTATNSAAFTVVPGALDHFVFAAIGTQTYASAFNVTLTARDANSNTVTGFTGTVDLTTTAGTISPTVSGAFSAGVRTQSVSVFQAGSGKTITATKTSGSETGTSASFTVNQVPLTVTAANTNRVFGAANPSFTASYSGFVNGDNSSVVQGAPGFSTSANPASAVGNYAITPSLGSLSAINYSFTTFNNGTLTIAKASSASAVATSANPSPTGSNVIFTATLTAVAPGSGTPTSTVQFRADGAALGSPVTLASGVASLTNASLSHGTHTITAEYTGDSNFLGSTNSLSPNQVINTSPTSANDTVARYTSSGAKVRVTTLLANDTDADADALTFTSFSATSAQGVTVSSNGAWMFYTPPDGFTDADSFSYVITDSGGLLSTGLVSITIIADLNQSQNVLATDDLGNGDFRTRFLGIPDRTYTIQFTTNLVTPDWQALGTAAANATGAFEFTDTPPPASPVRFYRSVYP